MDTLYVKHKWQVLKKRIRRVKLTTRITASNVILFSILISLSMYFVTLLTNQFLYFKNREELTTSQQKIEELLITEKEKIQTFQPEDRIPYIYKMFESYYIFDNYKKLMIIFDSSGRTSYGLNKDVYDMLILDQLKVNPQNIDINVMLDKNIITGNEILTFELFRSLNASENIRLIDLSLNVPTKGGLPFISESKLFGYDVMYTTLRFDTRDDNSLFISVFLYPELDSDFLLSLNSALMVSAIIGILFLSIFGKFFTRRALKPLVELSYIAQSVNKEVLNYRIPPTESNDEVDTLIKSLNLMLQNLEEAFDNQKRFVSDASHELRIPLTIVLGYIDLLKTMGTDDKALLDESLTSIETEATHMKNMVEKLLILARLENNRVKVTYEWVSVLDFMEKGLAECERLYPSYHFKLDLKYTDDFYIDLEIMTQIFRALVENAVKYSPEDTTITFHSELKNQFVEVSLSDEGRGIAKESIANLTNRFYRLNEDRNRKTGGSGLGLAIVDALIKAQSGHMRIDSEVGKGTKVSLYVPKKTNNRSS
ncbi:HAMP domain-containing sensor histidine kinase [Fusibacter bizertensis]|uniref:histidine kinase n=2 Tax=Fusibacter bizertensis TaxID=1488331 RepID=A0ABT6NA17_9FIRM|nr:HAMP domain-containing sensor histidine kinase [Fusibacter bizertensis]